MSDFEEDDWVPPSEAELKVLQAKRERNDKISKRIGDYLLKGYKMLATSCPVCQSIELEDKHGQKYCVACQEIDCHETSKDDPVLNATAAEKVLAESAFSSNRLLESINPDVVPGDRFSSSPPATSSSSTSQDLSAGAVAAPAPTASVPPVYAPPVQAPPAVAQPQQYSRLPVAVEDDRPRYLETGARPKVMLQQKSGVFDNCQVTLLDKLHWANQQLATETRVQQSEHLVHLIKSILETLNTLNEMN